MDRASIRDLLSSPHDPSPDERGRLQCAIGETVTLAGGRALRDYRGALDEAVLGHHHQELAAAVREAVGGEPALALGEAAGERLVRALSSRLAALAAGEPRVAHLTASQGEALDAALQIARLVSRRPRLLGCARARHGASFGALSVSAADRRRSAVEPLLESRTIPWGDASALERALAGRDVAAFVVEPLEVEAGLRVPPPGYLALAASLCRQHGALLIVDETHTALGRTGRMFASEWDGVEPEVIVVGAGLAGGLLPLGACLVRRSVWRRAPPLELLGAAPSSLGPAAAAALTTVEILQRDRLVTRAATLGAELGVELRIAAADCPLVHTVSGRGFLWGIEMAAQAGLRALTLGAIDRVATEVLPAELVAGLEERGFLVDRAPLAPDVVRIAAPLIASEESLRALVRAFRDTLAARTGSVGQAALGAVSSAIRDRIDRLTGKRKGE